MKREPYEGWEFARQPVEPEWDPRKPDPGPELSSWFVALALVLIVLATIAIVALLVAAPRSAPQPQGRGHPIAGLTGASRVRERSLDGLTAIAVDATPHLPAAASAVIPMLALSGTATWYRWHRGEAAAGPLLRRALGPRWRGQSVTVCATACVTVRLTDWCSCRSGRRLVDLDARSFARLAPLSAGVVGVMVSGLGPTPTGPPTDVEP